MRRREAKLLGGLIAAPEGYRALYVAWIATRDGEQWIGGRDGDDVVIREKPVVALAPARVYYGENRDAETQDEVVGIVLGMYGFEWAEEVLDPLSFVRYLAPGEQIDDDVRAEARAVLEQEQRAREAT